MLNSLILVYACCWFPRSNERPQRERSALQPSSTCSCWLFFFFLTSQIAATSIWTTTSYYSTERTQGDVYRPIKAWSADHCTIRALSANSREPSYSKISNWIKSGRTAFFPGWIRFKDGNNMEMFQRRFDAILPDKVQAKSTHLIIIALSGISNNYPLVSQLGPAHCRPQIHDSLTHNWMVEAGRACRVSFS